MLKRLVIGITLLILTITAGYVFAADTANLSVTATIISPGNCRFAAGTTLNFGNLDPANPVDVNASTTVTIRCTRPGFPQPVTYLISDDDGLYETGLNANRMRHTTILTQFLPYTMSIVPASATIPRNTNTTITINGTVLGASYQGSTVAPGAYRDTVVISIIP